jgi:hypothetical protein
MNLRTAAALLLLFQAAGTTSLPDNEFVRVTWDGAPCAGGGTMTSATLAALAHAPLSDATSAFGADVFVGERMFIALSGLQLNGKSMKRGLQRS